MKDSCSMPHVVRRLSDEKLFYMRCCEVFNKYTNEHDIEFQVFKNGKWINDSSICSPNYNFYVPDNEIKNLQLFLL